MIYYKGSYDACRHVMLDLKDNCRDLIVGLVPAILTGGRYLNSPEWVLLATFQQEVPMLQVFSFTDEKRRTFQWGLDEDRGETFIVCEVTQGLRIPVETPDGKKIHGVNGRGYGKARTAQEAYDQACADLLVNMREQVPQDIPLTDVTAEETPHKLFGKPGED